MRVVYLIGEPGIGKTTLLDATITAAGLTRTLHPHPFAHEHLTGPSDRPAGVMLGKTRPGGFGGTDALGLSVQPKALAWLTEDPEGLSGLGGGGGLVVGEGDRLATPSFLTAAARSCRLRVVLLTAAPGLAASRRAERAALLGKPPQQGAWVTGRVTKTRNLARLATDGIEVSAGLGTAGWHAALGELAEVLGWRLRSTSQPPPHVLTPGTPPPPDPGPGPGLTVPPVLTPEVRA